MPRDDLMVPRRKKVVIDMQPIMDDIYRHLEEASEETGRLTITRRNDGGLELASDLGDDIETFDMLVEMLVQYGLLVWGEEFHVVTGWDMSEDEGEDD